ncbi:hypothetical protein [Brevibacterium sp. VCM10]|nr:hypothetical protein [Brevibacterium sp. VCM10]
MIAPPLFRRDLLRSRRGEPESDGFGGASVSFKRRLSFLDDRGVVAVGGR